MFRRVAVQAWGEARLTVLGIVFLCSSGIAQIEATRETGAVGTLVLSAVDDHARSWALVVAIAVHGAARFLGELLLSLAGERISMQAQLTVVRRWLHEDIEFFDETPMGELLSVLTQEIECLRLAATAHLPEFASGAVVCMLAVLRMSEASQPLLVTGTVAAPAVGLLAACVGARVSALKDRQRKAAARATSVAAESFASIHMIRTLGGEDERAALHRAHVEVAFAAAVRERVAQKSWQLLNLAAGALVVAHVLRAGTELVRLGQLAAADLSSFLALGIAVRSSQPFPFAPYRTLPLSHFSLLYASSVRCQAGYAVNDTSKLYGLLVASSSGCGRLLCVLAHTRSRLQTGDGAALPDCLAATAVSFRDVSFRYARQSTCAVIHLSFDLERHQTTFLVGASGSGKSTLLHLLSRVRSPTDGSILVGGAPVSAISEQTFRSYVGVASQEGLLLRGSIRENFTLGSARASAASAERVETVARAFQAHDFIVNLGGYDSAVGERGGSLSGGQRQMLALCRAILRDPSLLLLDEATSALDPKTEALVNDAIQQFSATKTLLVASHRLSVAAASPRIMVFDRGLLVADGRHAELLELNECYARLWNDRFGLGRSALRAHLE